MTNSLYFHHEQIPYPVYSILVSHHGKRIQEEYFEPCSQRTLHRMFSVTKSYTALAVCALAAEGRISLSDPIINYFPDYTPEDPHPWLAQMTVQDLLDMRTCHKATTYKLNLSENWVRSFFVTPPDHRSGQIFKYDTSAAHTLAALVKRVSGNGILDYLRPIYLNQIGFSEEAHVLCDPFGDEIGGSGMLALPEDLMVTAEFLMALYQDTWKERYASVIQAPYDEAFFTRYCDLIRQCVSFRSATMHEGKTLDECQGYGSQFWRLRNGFMMYGMGGQYAAFFPEEDLIIVTTADSQSLQGGTQYLLDEMNRIDTILRTEAGRPSHPVSLPDCPEENGDAEAMLEVLSRLSGTYRFLENPKGFLTCRIDSDAVTLKSADAVFRFPTAVTGTEEIRDPKYHQRLHVRTSALRDGSLYQYVQIQDEYLGSIRILIQGGDGKITIYLRKIEESLFSEMDGFFEAEQIAG